ncbi:MAG: Amt family ammonium transporter, partial [Marivirga sp.]
MSVFENAVQSSENLSSTAVLELTISNVWMMLCIALVFIMHLGFACVESGFTQSKNTVNILFKNTLTPAIGLISYTVLGFNLMYPDFANGPGWIDFNGFFLSDDLG